MDHADNNINFLVNEITTLINEEQERKKQEKKHEENMNILEEQIDIILKRESNEYFRDYNIYNIKMVLNLLISIIKYQNKDIKNLKEYIKKNKLKN